MATIEKSLLKTNKKTGKAEISFRFCGGRGKGLTVRAGSGIFISESRWSKDGNVIIPRLATHERDEILFIVELLDRLQNHIFTEYSKIKKDDFSKEWLEKLIDDFHNPPKPEVSSDKMKVLEFLDYYIKKKAPLKTRKKDGLKLQPNAIQQYNATYKHLSIFINGEYKTDIDFKILNEQFYKSFVAYLQSRKFTQNTVGKHIRILKTLINDAPLELRKECDLSKFVVFNVNVDNVYLTEEELEKLWNYDFSATPDIEIARDWFLIACWTGSRYSDLHHFVDIKVDKKTKSIEFNQTKTSTKVVIPIHPVVNEIYEKYNWKLPEVVVYHNINDNIRLAVEKAGIDDEVIIEGTEGGKKTKTKFKKFQLVSTHTGRRSFCTNMYLQKIPIYQIMAISGHKTEKNFLKYIKISTQKYAEMLLEIWQEIYSKKEIQPIENQEYQKQIIDLINEKNALSSQILNLINENSELKMNIDKLRKEIIRLNIKLRN